MLTNTKWERAEVPGEVCSEEGDSCAMESRCPPGDSVRLAPGTARIAMHSAMATRRCSSFGANASQCIGQGKRNEGASADAERTNRTVARLVPLELAEGHLERVERRARRGRVEGSRSGLCKREQAQPMRSWRRGWRTDDRDGTRHEAGHATPGDSRRRQWAKNHTCRSPSSDAAAAADDEASAVSAACACAEDVRCGCSCSLHAITDDTG